MPITHEWLIPDQVMGLRWTGIITEEDLQALDAVILQILNAAHGSHIHFISNELDLLKELSVKSYIQTRSPRHTRFGWYIVVQPRHNAFARMVTQMACSLLQIRFRIVENEESAWDTLQRINPQILRPGSPSSNRAS